MNPKFSITLILAFFCAFGINTIEAQTEESKKVIIKKKIIDKDGKETIEIEEIEGEDANIFILKEEGKPGEEIEIEVEVESAVASDSQNERQVKIINLGPDGEKKIIKWNGEGEMPEEVKELMEEHEINLEQEVESSIKEGRHQHKKVKAKFIDEDGHEQVIEWEGEGEMPEEVRKMMEEKKMSIDLDAAESNYRIKIMGEDGEMEEMEWNGEGEMPEEMKKIMDAHEIEVMKSAGHDTDIVKIMTKEIEGGNNNKAQLGIMISPADNGVSILNFVDGSPALKSGLQKGDIITKLDGKAISTMEQLVESLSDKKAGDKVEIEYLRDGISNRTAVPLTARKKQLEKSFQWKEIDKN